MTETNKNTRAVTIEVPRGAGLFGFDAIFKVLFLFAGWMLVVIAAICVPGSLAGAVLAAYVGVTNVAVGLPAALLGFGCAVGCVGLCIPCLTATKYGFGAVLMATREAFGLSEVEPARQPAQASFPGGLVAASLAILLVGAAVAGVAALMGEADAVMLPDFPEKIFSAQPANATAYAPTATASAA